MKSSPHTKGFTLIELMIVMAIFSIVILVLTDLFSSILDVRKDSESVASVQQDSSYILSRMFYDIPRASAVTVPATLGGTGSSLQITINGVTNTYALSGTDLTLANANGTDVLNSSEDSVSDLTFTRIGNGSGKDSISLSFKVTSKIIKQSGQDSKTITTTVSLQ